MEWLSHPLLLGTPIGLLSIWLGYLGYQRSKRADANAVKRGEVGEIYSGFSLILDNLQEDNKTLRDNMSQIRLLLTAAEENGIQLADKILALRTRVKNLEHHIKIHGLIVPINNNHPQVFGGAKYGPEREEK